MREEIVAIVPAAGVGSRLGQEVPKQFVDLNGRAVIARTVANLAWCSRIVVVHHPDHRELTVRMLDQAGSLPALTLVPGGPTRRLSIAAALEAISDVPDGAPVVIQNAASPNTPPSLVAACVAALETHEMAQAFVPAVHTIFREKDGEMSEVLQRSTLGYTADPTAYRLSCLRAIAARQAEDGDEGHMMSDTARAMGTAIRLVPSPESNLKLTTPNDLILLRHLTAGT